MSHICKAPRSPRLHLSILVLVLLIGSAANFPLAVFFIKSRTQTSAVPTVLSVSGNDAAQFDWPAPTPHEFEWPRIKQYQVQRAFGYERIQAWGDPTAQMTIEFMGWPLPVLERSQMWWDWNDPIWTTAAESDPAMRVHWVGAIANPLIFAVAIWVLLFGFTDVWRWQLRWRRSTRNRCVACGYDLQAAKGTRCPECGTMITNGETDGNSSSG